MDGTPFGRYRLVELLGRGGMGEVWRAHDTVIDRTVAIKMLLPHFAQDKTFEQRFRREARAAARLDEPHVVPIYNVGEVDGRLYVAMRLINGQDLQTLLDRGPLEPDRAIGIIEQIVSALQAAHRAQLVHRDVKPSNILVTADDFAYLIDFGIARAAGETGITSTGATIGTWSYMAPERFSSGEIEPSSDIYALACVLYQSLTGELPFPGTTLEQVAMAHMSAPPPKPSTLRRAIALAMDDVIAIGLAKDPGQRYRTAKDLANAAGAALTTGGQAQADTVMADTQAAPTSQAPVRSGAPGGDAVSPRDDPGDTNVGKARRIAIATAGVVVILTAGLFSVWRPWERQAPPRPRGSPGSTTSMAQVPPQTTTAEPTSATPIVGEVPGEPEGAAALRPWVRDLVSLSTAALAAKCWTIAPDSAKRMYADTTPILNAVRRQGVEGQYGVFWNDETTRVSVRSSEIRSGYACPYVETNTGGNHLTPNDAEYIVQRYLSRVVGKPVNPDDVESRYSLECNNLSPVARQLLGKVTSFEVNSIRSNGDLEYPVVTVTVNRAGSTRDIHVSLSGGIYGSDDIYCIANSD